jgi:hypothetical protein
MTCYHRIMIRPHGAVLPTRMGIVEILTELSEAVCLLMIRYTERSCCNMNNTDVPIWEKYTLSIEEASRYFRIGEKKLRRLAEENLDSGWVIVNGNRIQIKRKQFEKIIDTLDEI